MFLVMSETLRGPTGLLGGPGENRVTNVVSLSHINYTFSISFSYILKSLKNTEDADLYVKLSSGCLLQKEQR